MYNLPNEILAHVPEADRTPAKIRAYGEANGFQLGKRGRLPRELYEKYAAEFPKVAIPPETYKEALDDAVPF